MTRRLSAVARWTLWLGSLGLLVGIAWTRLDLKHPINTDILAMLPAEHGSHALAVATERSRDAFVHQVLVLVGGDDSPATHRAALAADHVLTTEGLRNDDSGLAVNKVLAVFQAHRYVLLNGSQAAHLAQGGAESFAKDVAVVLARPAGIVSSFDSDPGGYLARYLSALPRPYADFLPDGLFFSARRGGRRYFLLSLASQGDGFTAQGDMDVTHAVATAREAVARICPHCSLDATGAPLFAEAARREAQQETLWLTVASMLLIMVLIAYVFRSLAPHVLAALQLVSSVLAACAAVVIYSGSIQILTLVFGTTLLGIAIDYALLYFAEYWFGDDSFAQVPQKVRPGLSMGLATGVAAFAFLLLAGFPALVQIALFSIAGLLEAAIVVVLIFPVTLTATPRVAPHAPVHWPQRFMIAACRRSRWRWQLPILVLLLCIPGWLKLGTSDDVRELQHLPSALLRTDAGIRNTLEQVTPPGFFLVEGSTLDEALSREEMLFARLQSRLPDTTLLGLSRFLPSNSEQQASLAAWSVVYARVNALRASFTHFGLPAGLADHLVAGWKRNRHSRLDESTLFKAAPEFKRFIIPTEQGVALLSTVTGKRDFDASVLQHVAATVPGASFVQPLARIAATFRRIRVRTTWLVVLGYVLISMLLIWRYGRRDALRMLYTPLLAIGVTLGVLGWLGDPINIFVIVALILILGLGRDYTVFLREGGAYRRSPALAVCLSALTMLCSFGLLTLSAVPALHTFGIATLVGILASFLSAPLSLPPRESVDP